MQDGVHLVTKVRNRLLSTVATLRINGQDININHLLNLIENYSKIDHYLVKSDVRPHDRQNYSSCLKITSDDVLNLLNETETKATFVYLYLLKLIILAYVKKDTDILARLYYGWIVVFASSLRIKQDLSQIEKDNCFITKAAWISSEINIHCLTSIIILVSSGKLPWYALNVYLFSSQSCEAAFPSARSLSGSFSSITNFSVFEFMNKIEKISILNKIKFTEESNNAICSLKFPVHHKNLRNESSTAANNQNPNPITTVDIEKIILKAYKKAESIMNELKLTQSLKRNELNDFKNLNSFVFYELSERLIVDYSFVNDEDIEEISDDETCDANDNTNECSDADDELSENVLNDNNQIVHNMITSKQTFQGMKIYEQIDQSKKHNYFPILINNKQKFIHKQTAARLLTKTKNSLSSNRLSRVQQANRQE
ncbi:unnamed protein product [Rotaria sp. Silwood2]|nr:unnamed protein product [Rotaria sp. Silwood2]